MIPSIHPERERKRDKKNCGAAKLLDPIYSTSYLFIHTYIHILFPPRLFLFIPASIPCYGSDPAIGEAEAEAHEDGGLVGLGCDLRLRRGTGLGFYFCFCFCICIYLVLLLLSLFAPACFSSIHSLRFLFLNLFFRREGKGREGTRRDEMR